MTGNLIMPGGAQAATQTYVNTAISNLINAAPTALDTLAELSTALNNDASFATTVTNSIASKLALSGGTLTGVINISNTSYFVGGSTGGFRFNDSTDAYNNFIIRDNGNTYTRGNVGIGTTNPIAPLHIYSANQNMASSASTSYTYAKFRLEPYYNSSVGISMGLISPNVNYIQASYSDGSSAPLSLQPYGGNVYIGKATDDGYGKLQVSGNITATGAYKAGRYGYLFPSYTGNKTWELASDPNVGDGAYMYANGTGYLQTWSPLGRVGIGTTAPGVPLDVVGSSLLTGTVYATIRSSQDQTNYRGTVLGYDASGQIGVVYSESNGLASSLAFWTYSGSSWGERVRITGPGNFGIGTNSPSGKFHVDHGDAYHQGILHTYDSTFVTTTKFGRPSTSSYLAITYDIAGSEIAYINRAYSSARLLFQRNGSTDLEISGSGKVGIGVTGPDYKLDVAGPIRASRVVYQWYWGSWQGNGTYWHIKTDLWGGGSPAGNNQYTMSFFKGYSYSYGGSILEGSCGFHNWSGTIYSFKTTGNIFSNAYVSSDGYVVLVIPSGSGETGVVIDWHQHFEYPTRVCNVTAAGLHGSTSGRY